LAGRSLFWPLIGLSLIAANISTEHFVGMSGQGAGKYAFIHSCGKVDELFDDLFAIGLNCFNPFQPKVMDIDSLFSKYHQKLAFWGGLSMQKTLPQGRKNLIF